MVVDPKARVKAAEEETTAEEPAKCLYNTIKLNELEAELETNKKLIEMTKGDESGEDSAASDSEPSEDNLSEEEMAKIIPIKPTEKKPVVKKPEPKKKPEPISANKKQSTRNIGNASPSSKSAQKPLPPAKAPPSRSPIKRIM